MEARGAGMVSTQIPGVEDGCPALAASTAVVAADSRAVVAVSAAEAEFIPVGVVSMVEVTPVAAVAVSMVAEAEAVMVAVAVTDNTLRISGDVTSEP
jgi:hydroxymethylpyrimidine/phosphomethylpyrimidine kinase